MDPPAATAATIWSPPATSREVFLRKDGVSAGAQRAFALSVPATPEELRQIAHQFDLVDGTCYFELERKRGAVLFVDALVDAGSYVVLGEAVPTTAAAGTAIVSDGFMSKHKATDTFVEKPNRMLHIMNQLESSSLLSRCTVLPGRKAFVNEVTSVHAPEYVSSIAAASRMLAQDLENRPHVRTRSRSSTSKSAESDLESFARTSGMRFDAENHLLWIGGDVFFNQFSFDAALFAAGCALEAVDAVMSGRVQNAFAVVRPPGHHATKNEAMGFCLFSNCGIAAQHALQHYGPFCRRVLIVDFDIHHGNGLEDIFYDRNDVLYISSHRYDDGSFYPGTGHLHRQGADDGLGFNMNIPFDRKQDGYSDGDFLAVFHQLILPVATEFDPDLVIIAAGFDAARGDPLGRYNVSPAAFAAIAHLMKGFAGGRLVMVLEGGYNVQSIADCVEQCVRVLLGDPVPRCFGGSPSAEAVSTIRKVGAAFSPFWQSLSLFAPPPPPLSLPLPLLEPAAATPAAETAVPEAEPTGETPAEPLVEALGALLISKREESGETRTVTPPAVTPPEQGQAR